MAHQQQNIYPNLQQNQPHALPGVQPQLAPNVMAPITTQPTNTTLIINNQPTQMLPAKRDWSVSLCDICHNPKHCLCYWFFGPCYSGCQAARMGESFCVGCCLGQAGHLAMRTKIRTAHNIEGGICNDCCVIAFCGCCAACQMSVEMDKMGYRD